MQFHYHYPHYYLPLERNQDDGRGRREEAPPGSDGRVPLEPMVGIPLKPTLVLSQEQTELLPQDLPLNHREVAGLVYPW